MNRFAYSLAIKGEFLAIDSDGRIFKRLPMEGEPELEPQALATLASRLLEARDHFCAANGIRLEDSESGDSLEPLTDPL